MKENIVAEIQENASPYKKYLSPGFFRSHIFPALWAQWCLRRATHVGRTVRAWGRLCIRNYGRLWIGEHVRLDARLLPLELDVRSGGCLEIFNGTYINYGCSICAMKLVHIGANCMIGTYAIISDNQFHRIEPERRYELPESLPVILEDNVWLGSRVIVLPGVTIGEGSAIGAGSVVTRDIPPRSVAVGAPARVIKKL